MGQIAINEVYQLGLQRLSFGPTAEHLLTRLLAEDDSAKDFEHAVRIDRFFTRKILEEANKVIKLGNLKSISHAVVLIGEETVRDFVLGHSVRRVVDPQADKPEIEFASAKAALGRALQAESLARKLENPHFGLALGVGFLWDIFEQWILSDPVLAAAATQFFQRNWTHAIRTAVIAWSLATNERLDVPLKRLIFAGGLAHDIGKPFLCCTFPKRYIPLIPALDEIRIRNPYDDLGEIWVEKNEFDVSHPELGSFLMSCVPHTRELEELVDFHHDFNVLRVRNPNLFLVQCILKMSDQIAFLLDSKPSLDVDDLQKILNPFKSAFPLRVMEVQSRLVTLRAKGLLP